MNRCTRTVLAALGLLAALGVAPPAQGASFQGRNVDDRRYQASILNHDYGLIDNVEVRFHGENAFVRVRGGGQLVLILQDEQIEDPHRIPAHDPERGIMWEINVKNLRGR